MRIALLGGTGNLGKGLAVRLSMLGYEVIVGSRSEEKALRLAKEYSEIAGVEVKGAVNSEAAKLCDVAFFTIPWEHAFTTAESLREELRKKKNRHIPARSDEEGEQRLYIRKVARRFSG